MTWQDITSFSQGDKVRTPATWQAHAGRFRVIVTRDHRYFKPNWAMAVYPLFQEAVEIKGIAPEAPPEVAQAEAEKVVRAILEQALNDL